MPKNQFRLPKNLEIQRLKNIYKPMLDKMIDVSQELKENFYEFVIPSFADPVVIKEISLSPRFRCLFKQCVSLNKSFSSKQKFIQHLTIMHDQELPKGGSFIAPNDKSTKPGGFWCSKCGHHYCRRDHLQNHIKTNVHCREALVLDQNPLELKEIEYDKIQAIEYPVDCEKKVFDFKPPERLAIEWKFNDSKNQATNQKKMRSLTKSFSFISISRNKPKFERKSRSFNIFSSQESSLIESDNNLEITKGKRHCLDERIQNETKKVKKEPIESNENDTDINDEELLKTLLDFESRK